MNQTNERVELVYQYIKKCLTDKRLSPTQREIAQDCKLSVATVTDYLSRLEAQGRIARTPLISRSIRLTDNTSQSDETAEEVYQFICDSLEDGNIPTQTEIAETCYLSRSEVRRALVWLETQGKIRRGKGQRNIQLVSEK
jgi:DNA-binding GntR family transcriptional regulator